MKNKYYVGSYGFSGCDPMGTVIASDPKTWENHVTAVLGEYAADTEDEYQSADEILEEAVVYGPHPETVEYIQKHFLTNPENLEEFNENVATGGPFAMEVGE